MLFFRRLLGLVDRMARGAVMVLRISFVAACLTGLCFITTAGASESVWTNKGGDARPIASTVSKPVVCLEGANPLQPSSAAATSEKLQIDPWSTGEDRMG